MNYRSERLTKVFEEELSRIIEKELEFEGALVTITSVGFSENLEHANIGFSVLPLATTKTEEKKRVESKSSFGVGISSSEKYKEVLKILNENKFKLRKLLGKKVIIRTMPQLDFKIDHGFENAAVVEKLLIKDQENPEPAEGIEKLLIDDNNK